MSALPDREERHKLQFFLFRQMGYVKRLTFAGGFIFLGLVIQALWPSQTFTTMFVVTLPLLFVGTLFLVARGYDLTLKNVTTHGEWQKTTRDRFQRARDLEEKIKKWDEAAIDGTNTIGVFTFLAVAFGVAGVWFWLGHIMDQPHWAIVFAVDAGVLLLPHWFTGLRRGWKPVSLRQEVDAVETALNAIEHYGEPPCQIQPMFEMGGADKTAPVGARAFVRFPDAPEDFLGLQFQVSVNDVQGTKYPYLYAVLVAKQNFGLIVKHADSIRARGQFENLTIETNVEDDVEVIVIRQPTTKTSGYHTKDRVVRHIARFAWDCATEILAAETVSQAS